MTATPDGESPIEPVSAGSWEWRYLDEAGVQAPGPGIAFEDQSAAEAWLTEHFEDLADVGITAVTLFDGEHTVYGPMPLAPEG